jgi:predicted naringenin-chalcone synthase
MAAHARVSERVWKALYPRNETATAPPPTHLVHVTSTGYEQPSPALKTMAATRWHRTQATHLYHMGCFAAMPAARVARALLLQSADAECAARCDVIHTEFVSLHLDFAWHRPDVIVGNSLFGDGAIRYSVLPADAPAAAGRCGLDLLAEEEAMIPGTIDDMSWLIGESNFTLALSTAVPTAIRTHLSQFAERLREAARIPRRADVVYAIHPGGPKILDAARDALGLDESAVCRARRMLASRGNMSAATVPHLWAEILADRRVAPGSYVLSFGFGPGLTVAGAAHRKIVGG